MQEEVHGYMIKPFGLDTLFEVIYDYLKEFIIEKETLQKIKYTEDETNLLEIIDLTSLTKIYHSKIDLMIAIKNKISRKINLNSYLYLLAKGINEGIKGTRIISEDFKKSYEK